MQKITVLLADDHPVVRQWFRAWLEVEPDMAIVGEAGTGRQAVKLARELQPDVVLMDIAGLTRYAISKGVIEIGQTSGNCKHSA
jgi:DNA-binding NarL/FixJ family response regulator